LQRSSEENDFNEGLAAPSLMGFPYSFDVQDCAATAPFMRNTAFSKKWHKVEVSASTAEYIFHL
jgi:hypothetical protein